MQGQQNHGSHGRAAKRQALVARLRNQIAGIEKRTLGEERGVASPAGGEGFQPAPAGILHEVWTDQDRNAGAALGFALGQARSLLTQARPAILWVQLAHEASQTGLPYAPGFQGFGLDPEMLVICRVHSITELLWAVEEAAGCRSVAAVIADVVQPAKALDFTASRRLSMRAEGAMLSIFMVRYGTGREASAAGLRWRVMPALSALAAFDARAPGVPRFAVELEKGQLPGGGRQGGGNWFLKWTDDGFAIDDNDKRGVGPDAQKWTGEGRPAALSGAALAALGHRLPETA